MPAPASAPCVAATSYVAAGHELGALLFGQLCLRIGEERAHAWVRYLTAPAPSLRDGSPPTRDDHLAGRRCNFDDCHDLVTAVAGMEARP